MYDSVAQNATSNSHILFRWIERNGCMDSVPARLKKLRTSADPKLSIRRMAALLGVPPGTYVAYEDVNKFKKAHLPLDLAKRIAAILADHRVSPADVMELAGIGEDTSYSDGRAKEILAVQGAVEAGAWRSQSDWPPDQQYSIEVGPNPYPGTTRFGVRLEGVSMNRTIPPGSELECIYVADGILSPRPGDLVIVERHEHDLTEMTCKRLDVDGDEWVLRCESYDDGFQDIIRVGRPDPDLHIDNETRIIGIVVGAQKNFRRSNPI